MTKLLELKKLQVSYGNTKILQDISLSLNRGEILGIVGESGSGKSTLLNAIMGLEKDLKIDSGQIVLKGRNLLKEEKRKNAIFGKEIGIVFQSSSYSLVPTRKIRKQFEEAVLVYENWTKEEIRIKSIGLFKEFGLKEPERVYDSYPFELSGGMKQRVSLAMALILSPELLLCDEPTSGLDVQVEKEIIKLLGKLREEKNIGILLITHNLLLAQYLCDKIIVMYGGRILEYRPAKALIKAPYHPYTKDLLEAVPKFLGQRPKAIEGLPPKFPLDNKCVYKSRCKYACEKCQTWLMDGVQLEDGLVSCWRVQDERNPKN